MVVAGPEAVTRVAQRVQELASGYDPPAFAHVRDPDAALFLCAIDHRTGYRARYLVGGRGPYEGSALLWAVGVQSAERRAGLLTAAVLQDIHADDVADLFRIGGETVFDPDRRAALWRDLAHGLLRDHAGKTSALLEASEGCLGGGHGLLAELGRHEAFADPLHKKAFLFAKIAERRGWVAVTDPESWEVCADNVLMRLALRSGLVEAGSREEVRLATRDAFRAVAHETSVPAPVLDDLLWELGRDDPDLLGTEGGDLREPDRDPDSTWY